MDALIELQEARPGHKWKWSVEYGFQCEACGRPANKLGVVCK